MNEWEDLVTAALLGTERRPIAPGPGGEPLGDLLARLDPADQEGALLGAAAATALYRRAAWLPPRDPRPLPEPSPPDNQPRCSPRATQHLVSMLRGQHREVLPEWLAAAAAAGWRVPERHLPALLELGRTQADLRVAILPLLGVRGRWLAAQNPAWDYASVSVELRVESSKLAEPERSTLNPQLLTLNSQLLTIWETGSRAARLALLQRLRAENPAQARELVAGTWAEEKADDRAAFLATFERGLSMADEPFLEAALDDRSKEVRRAAADLLARQPESWLVGRMIERVRPLLAFNRGLLRGLQIEVTLPTACDKSMIRDGIEQKPASGDRQLGEKGWWLHQMLSTIPPALWSRVGGAMPGKLIEAARAGEWSRLLLGAWGAAAERYQDADWAEALLRASLDGTSEVIPALITVLSPDRREELLFSIQPGPSGGPVGWQQLWELLQHCNHAWSTRLGRMLVESLRRDMASAQPVLNSWQYVSILKEFAVYMSPALAPELATGWPTQAKEWHRWEAAVDRFLILLQFRYDMLEALRR